MLPVDDGDAPVLNVPVGVGVGVEDSVFDNDEVDDPEDVGVAVGVAVDDDVGVANAELLGVPELLPVDEGLEPLLRVGVGVAVIVDDIDDVLEGVGGGVAVSEVV